MRGMFGFGKVKVLGELLKEFFGLFVIETVDGDGEILEGSAVVEFSSAEEIQKREELFG